MGGTSRTGLLWAADAIRRLIPACCLLVRPSAARRAVVALNVGQAPAYLGGRVGLPVASGTRHLRPGQRLRDAVGAGTRVLSIRAPAALVGPQRLEAGELAARPAELAQHLLSDLLRRSGRGAGRLLLRGLPLCRGLRGRRLPR